VAVLAIFFVFQVQKKETIKIGAIMPISAPAAHHADVLDAMLLAADKINSSGGINGRKMELIIEDSKSNRQKGKKAFNRIEASHHPVLYVSTTSSVSMALAPLAEENNVCSKRL
jgi:branched-chain amino acid transport system substrate-binding protein